MDSKKEKREEWAKRANIPTHKEKRQQKTGPSRAVLSAATNQD